MPINISPVHTFTYASAQINVYHANVGQGLPKHEHTYSHATVCHNGKISVKLDGRSYVMDKESQPLNLPAGEWHEIEAIEDYTVFVNIFEEGKY
jgi:quercetin dioxygenase-like cupin family protein